MTKAVAYTIKHSVGEQETKGSNLAPAWLQNKSSEFFSESPDGQIFSILSFTQGMRFEKLRIKIILRYRCTKHKRLTQRSLTYFMDKLYLTGLNLCLVFNSRSGRMFAIHLLWSITIRPNLELKTPPNQL